MDFTLPRDLASRDPAGWRALSSKRSSVTVLINADSNDDDDDETSCATRGTPFLDVSPYIRAAPCVDKCSTCVSSLKRHGNPYSFPSSSLIQSLWDRGVPARLQWAVATNNMAPMPQGDLRLSKAGILKKIKAESYHKFSNYHLGPIVKIKKFYLIKCNK